MGRVRRAFMMASVEQYLTLAINFAMIAVLSRLLPPSEIGIAVVGLGIAVVVFSLREFATAEFLIQRPHVGREDVRTSLTVLVLFTLALGAALLLLSPVLSGFYAQPGLAAFLRIMVLASLLEVVSQPTIALMRREMEFGVIARIRVAALFVMAATTIALAAAGHGFMSYAWGTLLSGFVTTVMAVAARPAFGSFVPSLASWRTIAEFGRFRGATGLVDRAHDVLPQLVLGRFMPMASVGIYNRMTAVCAIPDRMLLGAVFAVAFPALSEGVRQGHDIRGTYLTAIGYVAVFYWPALLLLAILAYPVVSLVLGPSWREVVPLVRIVAVASLFYFPVILTAPILMALGRNREAFLSNLLPQASSAVILCVASGFGLTAMALSQFVAIPLHMLIALRFVRSHVHFAWSDFALILARSAAAAVGAIVGPLAVIALYGFRFQLTVYEALMCAPLSALGWLLAVLAVRHPVVAELRLAGALLRMPFGRAASDPTALAVGRQGTEAG